MNEVCYLAYHKGLNENAKPHERFTTNETIFTDTKDGMLFTARQVFDIIECLKMVKFLMKVIILSMKLLFGWLAEKFCSMIKKLLKI